MECAGLDMNNPPLAIEILRCTVKLNLHAASRGESSKRIQMVVHEH
jgi:hypothetical protein